MDENKTETAVLTAIVSRDFHSRVKIMATMKGIGLQKYIAQAIIEKVLQDESRQ